MPRTLAYALLTVTLAGCGRAGGPSAADATKTPLEARQGFTTKLTGGPSPKEPAATPPPNVFHKVAYESPAGKLAAYVTPNPLDGKKRPAIVWITGGDCNSIDRGCWTKGPASNDQSASAFREAGVAMMFPSLRGGNDNPGRKEGFLGEIDDVLAAADYLRAQDFIDAERVYLGGHSTGGTVALLAAESTDKFRAVFAFGPVDDVSGYGPEFCPFDLRNPREVELRSPGRWLHAVKRPTFVFEGATDGNADSLRAMKRASTNPNLHFFEVKRAGHFSVLAPVTKLIAAKVVADTGAASSLAFTDAELNGLFGR